MVITFSFGRSEKKERDLKGKSIIDFPANYVLFDIETTGLDSEFDEIIEIGAIKVDNNQIVDEFHSLIKPNEMIDEFITNLTGITNEMVENAPSINDVLPLFLKFIGNNILIGHNVNFDINFIYDSLCSCGISPISNDFIDTLRIARRVLPELSHHRLTDLAIYYNIDSNGNHRALKDVEITNIVFNKLKEEVLSKYSSIDEFKQTISRHSRNIKYSDIKATVNEFNEDNPFYKKCVAITGTLQKMQRKDAMQIIANLGGICQDGVNKDTNYLILGNNDYHPLLKGKKSNKLIKAENLKLSGKDIEIISENIFYDIIDEYYKI